MTVVPTFTAVSVNGDTASSQTRTLSFPPGTQVVLTVEEQPRYPWNGDWRSPDPAKLCNGTVGVAPGFSMTFSSLQQDVVCEAFAGFSD